MSVAPTRLAVAVIAPLLLAASPAVGQRPSAESVAIGGVPIELGSDTASAFPTLRQRCRVGGGPAYVYISDLETPVAAKPCSALLEISAGRITMINQDWPVDRDDKFEFADTMIRAVSTILESAGQGQSTSRCSVRTVQVSNATQHGRSLIIACGDHVVAVNAVTATGSPPVAGISRTASVGPPK